jgi:predicted chitinase
MNVDTLIKAMTVGSTTLPRSKAEAYLGPMEKAMTKYDITSEMRSRMWLAQCGHESLSLLYFEEIADGSAYEGRKDLGNTSPGDGKKYKGRGPIQITGKYNYTKAQESLGIPLVDQPTLAADPFGASFDISAWWWYANGLNAISDTGDVTAATKKINGGTNGLSDRQTRYGIAQKLGAAVIVTSGSSAPSTPSTPAAPAVTLSDDMVIKEPDGKVYQLIYGGSESYWRGLPANAVAKVPASSVIADDGSLLALWRSP